MIMLIALRRPQIPISEAPKAVPAASRTEVVGDGVTIQVTKEHSVSTIILL